MRWWIWPWIAALAWLTIGGARIQLSERRNPLTALMSLFSGSWSILGLLVHFSGVREGPLAWTLAPACVAGAVWFVIESIQAIAEHLRQPVAEGLSVVGDRTLMVIATVTMSLLFGPGYAFGVRAGVLAWERA